MPKQRVAQEFAGSIRILDKSQVQKIEKELADEYGLAVPSLNVRQAVNRQKSSSSAFLKGTKSTISLKKFSAFNDGITLPQRASLESIELYRSP